LPKGRPLYTGLLEFVNPLHHYVDIAQRAQPLKQALARFLHGLPVGIGINRHQSIR
jgi:hypothetical protein